MRFILAMFVALVFVVPVSVKAEDDADAAVKADDSDKDDDAKNNDDCDEDKIKAAAQKRAQAKAKANEVAIEKRRNALITRADAAMLKAARAKAKAEAVLPKPEAESKAKEAIEKANAVPAKADSAKVLARGPTKHDRDDAEKEVKEAEKLAEEAMALADEAEKLAKAVAAAPPAASPGASRSAVSPILNVGFGLDLAGLSSVSYSVVGSLGLRAGSFDIAVEGAFGGAWVASLSKNMLDTAGALRVGYAFSHNVLSLKPFVRGNHEMPRLGALAMGGVIEYSRSITDRISFSVNFGAAWIKTRAPDDQTSEAVVPCGGVNFIVDLFPRTSW